MATTDERFARALAFERGAHEQTSARVEALRYGQAWLDERLPLVYWANLLWVTARDGVSAAELDADVDRLLSGVAHRQLVVEHESLWRTLDEHFAAAGWETEAILYMTNERPSDRMPDLSAVREVGHEDVFAAEERSLRAGGGRRGPARASPQRPGPARRVSCARRRARSGA